MGAHREDDSVSDSEYDIQASELSACRWISATVDEHHQLGASIERRRERTRFADQTKIVGMPSIRSNCNALNPSGPICSLTTAFLVSSIEL